MPGTGASGSQSTVTTSDAPRRIVHERTPQLSPIPSGPPMRSLSTGGPGEGLVGTTIALPPLRHISRTPPTPSSDRRAGNPLGVHSILNPQNEATEQQELRGRRRSASQMDSPSPMKPNLPSITRPNSVDSTQEDFMPNRRISGPGKLPSRSLTSPRPKSHVPSNLTGPLQAPTATIDVHKTPFLTPSAQPYPTEPPTSQSVLSAPPAVVGYFPPTAPTPPPGILRNDLRRASSSFPQSGSASPIMAYSPYSRPASIASSQFDPSGSSQPGSFVHVASSSQSQDMDNGSSMEEHHNMIPIQGSGTSSYQLMTISSQQGNIQIPVETQAASRHADEKRKRNAGASARFRARRKEKEREASTTIQNLQQQLREAGEDVDYYRSERDYYRSIVFQQPGADRMYGSTRPPSPRLRRGPAHNPPASTSAGGSVSSYSGYSEAGEPRSPDRNVRRRTSSYHPPAGPAGSAAMNGSSGGGGSYAGTAPPTTFAPPPPPPPPPTQQQQPQAQAQQQQQQLPHHSPAQQQQQHVHHPFDARDQRPLPDLAEPPRPIFGNPFTSESGRYEANRNWHPQSHPPGPAAGPDNRR